MKHVFYIWFVASICLLSPRLAYSGDCDCPQLSCSACQDQANLEFYTEKCPGTKKIRSCKRPVCTDKDPLPENCSASLVKPSPSAVAEEMPATEKPKLVLKHIGSIISSVGDASVLHIDGEKVAAHPAVKIFEGDTVETEANGKVVVKLLNENTIAVTPGSKAVLKLYETNETVHKTLINLMYGTIRSAVRKPKDAKNDFKVKTPSAVAGVRGTDFVTTYTDKVGITKIETLTGNVELTSPSGKHRVEVPQGKYASYVIPSHGGIQDDDIDQFVERGYMTDAQPLSEQDIAKIEGDTGQVRPKQLEVKKDSTICSEPRAKLNQCAWTCVGNPAEAANCRIDLPNVKCVRKRCNANGEWAEETRLPSSAAEGCESSKTVVAPCDY